MALLPLGNRRFRTRAASRDAATDLARLRRLRTSMLESIAEAQRERDGLQQRVEQYHAQAAFMLEDAADYGERPAEEEAGIAEAERQAEIAAARIRSLSGQVDLLEHLLDELDSSPVWQQQAAPA